MYTTAFGPKSLTSVSDHYKCIGSAGESLDAVPQVKNQLYAAKLIEDVVCQT